jgi:hypothetical protein
MAPPSQVLLNVYNADNELTAYVNGRRVYDRKTEGDPKLNDHINLVPFLKPGSNTLTLVGINWSGPSAFNCALTIGSQMALHGESHPDPGNGIVWERTIIIRY